MKLKLKTSLLVILIISFSLLIGCRGNNLSNDFNKDEIRENTKEVIEYINANDTDALKAMSNGEMKEALDGKKIDEIYKAIGEGGKFKELEKINIGGQEDRNKGLEYAIAAVKAIYEKESFTYTLSFTKDLKLAGLNYK